MKSTLIFLSLLCYLVGSSIIDSANAESTLKLVHVIFRHGDRTPDDLYPKDPYTEADFWPFGIGHLTNKGKMTAYKVGTSLRETYGRLLGDVYTPDVLQAVSSHYPRTKASLQAVLAGLYPPSEEISWNEMLPWEPIPYDYLSPKENKILFPMYACPRYISLVASGYEQASSDPIAIKYKHLLSFLKEVTGMSGSTIFEIGGFIYSTLKSEDEFGLPLPAWAETVYPDIVTEISAHQWKYLSGTDDLRAVSSGFLVSQIINNTYATLNQEESAKNRKIYLYSGHDANIAALLLFLNTFEPHNPKYGAHVIIQVHEIGKSYYFKFLYENYEHSQPEPLYIPYCGFYCSLERFIQLYGNDIDPARLEKLCG